MLEYPSLTRSLADFSIWIVWWYCVDNRSACFLVRIECFLASKNGLTSEIELPEIRDFSFSLDENSAINCRFWVRAFSASCSRLLIFCWQCWTRARSVKWLLFIMFENQNLWFWNHSYHGKISSSGDNHMFCQIKIILWVNWR